jgi:hypothetical protein
LLLERLAFGPASAADRCLAGGMGYCQKLSAGDAGCLPILARSPLRLDARIGRAAKVLEEDDLPRSSYLYLAAIVLSVCMVVSYWIPLP